MTNGSVVEDQLPPPEPHFLVRLLRVAASRPMVALGLLIIAGFLLSAVFANWIAPQDPNSQRLIDSLMPASAEHWAGTDSLGRDVLSRLIHGARVSMLVGVFSVLIAAVVGTSIGLIAGYRGGWIAAVLMRLVDALMSLPPIILAIALAAVLGPGIPNIVLSLAVALMPVYARMVAGLLLVITQLDYVTSARVAGAGSLRIVFRHILPNCLPPLIVLATLHIGQAILAEAALSYLGIGITPPQAAWGAMVADGYRYLLQQPMLSVLPGVCVMMTVMAFNLVGDALRDMLDPRLRNAI